MNTPELYPIAEVNFPDSAVEYITDGETKIIVRHSYWELPRYYGTKPSFIDTIILFSSCLWIFVYVGWLVNRVIHNPNQNNFHLFSVTYILAPMIIATIYYKGKIFLRSVAFKIRNSLPRKQNPQDCTHSFQNDGACRFHAMPKPINVHDIGSIDLCKISEIAEFRKRYQNGDPKRVNLWLQGCYANGWAIRIIDKSGVSHAAVSLFYTQDQCLPILSAIKRAYEATLKAAPLP